MSEQPTARAASRADSPGGGGNPRKPAGKKYLGLTRTQWLIGGGVFVAVIAYLLWKRHEEAKSTTTAATTSTAASTTAAQNAALQDELDSLLGSGGYGAAGAGGGGTVGTSGTTGVASVTTTAAASKTATTTAATTKTTTAAKPKTAGAISNLQATSVGTTTAHIQWNPAANVSQGYQYIVTNTKTNKASAPVKTNATSVNLTGLSKSTTYNFGIQALPGGAGNNIHFTTKS
jgi:hypothetical protein